MRVKPATSSPSPSKRVTKGNKNKTKNRRNKQRTPRLIDPPGPLYFSISSGLGSISPPASVSPTPSSPWATVASSPGASVALVPRSRLRGGGDLQTLPDWRAPLLATHASACALWGPPQFAHLAALCGYGWLFSTRHPSPGQRWSVVRCTQGGVVAKQCGVICLYPLHRL